MEELFFYYTDAIMIIRQQQDKRTITRINRAFTNVSGFSSEQLVGRNLADLSSLYPCELWELIDRLCSSITDNQFTVNAERKLTVYENKPIYAELYVTRINQSEGMKYTVTLHDRTEYKWIERADKKSILSSAIFTSTGLMKSLRYYHAEPPFDRSRLSLLNRREMLAQEDYDRVRGFMLSLRDSQESGQITFALQILEHKFQTTILAKPFYHVDGCFKCYAVLVLSMIPMHGSKYKVAIEKKSLSDNTELIETSPEGIGNFSAQEADPAYKLRLLMLENNVSVTQLAERTQISLTTISNIRNGKIRKPQRLTAHLIATELGVSPEEIWGD
ncbi:helix-turn-helix domain-containing protein [Paenibacillus montanisoli]|uniref:helix-turn-helix domain-containing protein n=1 Tax=Paenibacillus montanisoli TaxID=2081970 RepID=UPI001401C57C|nr:helix-turn-helix domain-containing protein [Paenibacillus montanisoli]